MKKDEYIKILHDTLDFSIFIGKNIFPKRLSVLDKSKLLKMHCFALLLRALTKAHAINVLYKNDLSEEANIVLRVLLEIQFIVCSIANDQSHFERYLSDLGLQKFKELKNLDQAGKHPECIFKIDEATKAKILELTPKYKGKKQLSIRDHAEKAGMLGLYYSSYSTLCGHVHSGPAEVANHFKVHSNNLTISRNYGADYDLVCFSGIEAMKNILNAISKVFSIEHEKLQELNVIYHELNGMLYRKYILRENVVEG
jgi:hypothetical protein